MEEGVEVGYSTAGSVIGVFGGGRGVGSVKDERQEKREEDEVGVVEGYEVDWREVGAEGGEATGQPAGQ